MQIKQILRQIYTLNAPYNVIVADGRFPKTAYLKELIANASCIIACDGAVKRLLQHKLMPTYIIGDCDSISPTLYKKFQHIITKDSNQNNNDLTKAVNLAAKLKLDNVIIFGATGLREDHSIANISLLAEFYKTMPKIAIISDYGIFSVHCGTDTIATIIGQQISLFTPLANTTISCQELKWPLHNYQLHLWHSGTLNQATQSTLNLKTNNPVIVYRAFCIKDE